MMSGSRLGDDGEVGDEVGPVVRKEATDADRRE